MNNTEKKGNIKKALIITACGVFTLFALLIANNMWVEYKETKTSQKAKVESKIDEKK